MNTKERAYLKGLAQNIDSVLSLGKSSLTPEFVEATAEALKARELIKVNVLKNCIDDPGTLAITLSERTRSEVVQVIGRKIVLYKKNRENQKIFLPGEKKPADKKNTTKKAFDSKNSGKKAFDKKSNVKKYSDKKTPDKKYSSKKYSDKNN
ncbi:MAG: YhbY family RNA-binding protein [Eubacterium sp.]|nr:YhbY family RNA-binding protein [Eubacterium sp.]